MREGAKVVLDETHLDEEGWPHERSIGSTFSWNAPHDGEFVND